MHRFILIACLVLLFFSCGDKKVIDVYMIENKSNDSIYVIYDVKENYEKPFESFIKVIIAPHSEKVFYMGGSSTIYPINENDDYLLFFDSLLIKPVNGILKLDFKNTKNWNYWKDWRFLRDYRTYYKFRIENKYIAK